MPLFDSIIWKDVAKRHNIRNIKVCYDMTSPKTEKREITGLIECAEELKCDNLIIVTNNDEREIKKDGYTIKIVPFVKFATAY